MNNPSLVYLAKSFYNAYIALEQLKPDDEILLMVPKLVNGAFSAELILKAILVEQNIPFGKDHNLKILFDKLPPKIQDAIWGYLATKKPEYSDVKKRDDELAIMSDAFVQWRYCYEGNIVPAFDAGFLSAFANAAITAMFELGYNVDFIKRAPSPEECAEIDLKFEKSRSESIKHFREIVKKKNGSGKK